MSVTPDMPHIGECDGGKRNVVESFDKSANLTVKHGKMAGNDMHDSIWIVKDDKCDVAVVYS